MDFYTSDARQGPRRGRPPSARDPRRRDPIVYMLLSSAQRTVLLRLAGIYRARDGAIMLSPHPPLGLETLSVAERTLRLHSLGAFHSITGTSWGVVV